MDIFWRKQRAVIYTYTRAVAYVLLSVIVCDEDKEVNYRRSREHYR